LLFEKTSASSSMEMKELYSWMHWLLVTVICGGAATHNKDFVSTEQYHVFHGDADCCDQWHQGGNQLFISGGGQLFSWNFIRWRHRAYSTVVQLFRKQSLIIPLYGAKDFCPNSLKHARKKTPKMWPLNKNKSSSCHFGRHFFQIEPCWALFLLRFSRSLLRFSGSLCRFSDILPRF